jgi:hypothetical protein
MYSVNGIKLAKDDVEAYRNIRNDPRAKREWWAEVKQRYALNAQQRYKIRFVALIVESN